MPVTQLEHRRRQIALARAVKANDIARVRRLLKDCREWDSVYHRISHHSDGELCSCCFKSEECMSPARDAALHVAIALGSRDMVNLILDSGVQFSPGDSSESFSSTAVNFEQVDILRLLLERNIGSARWPTESAVRSAITKGSFRLVEPFIEYGGVIWHKAVEIAIQFGKLEIVQALTEMTPLALNMAVLLSNAKLSAAHGHLDLVKYFVQQVRHVDETQVQVAALEVFKIAATVPILEFCMPLTKGISDDDRNIALNDAWTHGRTEAADFLVRHGATCDQSPNQSLLWHCRGESHFLYAWNLLGGTGNFSALTHDNNGQSPPVYEAIRQRFWNMIETCLSYPAFKMKKASHPLMVLTMRRAVEAKQEKLLWHMIEHVPESRSILLKNIVFPIPRSPAFTRMLFRCRELLIPTRTSPASRWEVSALSEVIFNLILHSRLRHMETVVAPIGLDPETYTAAVAALRRICLLTVRSMADGNDDASLKQDLRHELVTCAALPGCDTIPSYFATTICTEALERNDPVLFSVIRDALTGPLIP
ncbi:hypothetical protein DFS34DRAFT_348777 [Phlyctochytrium arcticum]|nr:hypothetical protein DFS34DRAFT_348777 [Phlyctochytrium arcticum]